MLEVSGAAGAVGVLWREGGVWQSNAADCMRDVGRCGARRSLNGIAGRAPELEDRGERRSAAHSN